MARGSAGAAHGAALTLLVCFSSAQAQTGTPDAGHLLMFSGLDFAHACNFVYGGLIARPRGIDADGVSVKLLFGGGSYRYRAGDIDETGFQGIASILPGWHFRRGTIDATAYAGLEVQQHLLVPDDPGNGRRGTHFGLRFGADLWYQPTTATMVNAWASWSSIGSGYTLRTAFGLRLFEALWIGPEVQVLGDDDSGQWRVGVHFTGLRFDATELTSAAGLARDTEGRDGFYVRIGVTMRR